MTDLLKALTAFFQQGGVPVYLTEQVPDGAAFPYAAYSYAAAPLGQAGACEVTGWYRGEEANAEAAAFLDRMAALLPEEGRRLALPDGRLTLYPRAPFLTLVTDGDAIGGRVSLDVLRYLPQSAAVGSLELGAGVFLLGLDLDAARSAADLRGQIADALADDRKTLGLTTGGGWFRCVPALRAPGEDARRPPTLDGLLLDGWTVTLSGSLMELNAGRVAALLPGCEVSRVGRVAQLRPGAALDPGCYLPRLCWVGDTTRGLVAIELSNALNVGGAAFHFVERGEGAMPFEFRAHQAAPGDGRAPCRVMFLED